MMSRARIFILTFSAMIAFAGNSLLCRFALKETPIDATSFTSIRIISGAIILWLIVRIQSSRSISSNPRTASGGWLSALALFAYAAGFSFSYLSLPTGTGALLLFGAVQATMIGHGIWSGERMHPMQIAGIVFAFAGLVGLLLPGISAPPLQGSVLMLVAGIAWGIYSLRGRGVGDPARVTAGNFLRATIFACGLSIVMYSETSLDNSGIFYAIVSGSIASGLGYAIWYTALRGLNSNIAATVQLSVPVIAAVGGIIFLNETVTLRFMITSTAILGGIVTVLINKKP